MKKRTKAEKRAEKLAAERIDKMIESSFRRVACGVQINIMDIHKVFTAGRAALAAGKDLDTAIREIVAVLRVN
jgi:hypothetical protein